MLPGNFNTFACKCCIFTFIKELVELLQQKLAVIVHVKQVRKAFILAEAAAEYGLSKRHVLEYLMV